MAPARRLCCHHAAMPLQLLKNAQPHSMLLVACNIKSAVLPAVADEQHLWPANQHEPTGKALQCLDLAENALNE